MITILNLETSALACSVSIGQDGQTLISKASDGEWKHSREITLLIRECLSKSGLSFDDIHAIAISGGPGSYTGLRVGASAAKGICYAKNIKLIAHRFSFFRSNHRKWIYHSTDRCQKR